MHSRRSPGSPASLVAPSHASHKGDRGATNAVHDSTTDVRLDWTAHPAQLQPLKAIAAFAAVSLTWWIALGAFGSPLVGLVGSLAIIGSLAEVLFSTHHRISSAGVFTRCGWQMRQMTWESVKSASRGSDGVHLSPLNPDARLNRIRGVTLRFANGNDEEVLAAVRTHWKRTAE